MDYESVLEQVGDSEPPADQDNCPDGNPILGIALVLIATLVAVMGLWALVLCMQS